MYLKSIQYGGRDVTAEGIEMTNGKISNYKSAILNLDTRLKKLEEKDPLAAELKRSKAQAELDAAVLQYELGLTFDVLVPHRVNPWIVDAVYLSWTGATVLYLLRAMRIAFPRPPGRVTTSPA